MICKKNYSVTNGVGEYSVNQNRKCRQANNVELYMNQFN